MRFRDPNWILILLFVGVIAAVPLIQALKEVREEHTVRALEIFSESPTAANLRVYEHNMEKASWAAALSRPWLQFAQFSWLKEGGEKLVFGSPEWYFYKPGLDYMLARQETVKPCNATHDPVTAIVDFRDQLASRGIRLVVMPVPNKDSIYPDRLTPRARPTLGVLAPRTREVLERLHAAKVDVIDLFKEFGQARQQIHSNAPLYLAQDTHWLPAGVSLAAKQVARRLTSSGWVRPGRIEYCERAAPVKRIGDILRMMQARLIERSVNPVTVNSVQVIRCDSGQPYKDEADAEILVLGDSFMRIYQEDEPSAAGFTAHLAKELKQPLMSLVNDGGGSTLVREELAARPLFLKNKKVVLWEFVERDIGIGLKGWQRTALPAPASETPTPFKESAGHADSRPRKG